MRKSYRWMKIGVFGLVVVILLLGCTAIIYNEAQYIIEDELEQILNKYPQLLIKDKSIYEDEKWENESDLLKAVYDSYYGIHISDVGFYSMLKDSEGNTLAHDQNYIVIGKNNSENTGQRFILLGNGRMNTLEECEYGEADLLRRTDNYNSIITGKCDDTFVYVDKIIWQDSPGKVYTYIPMDKVNAPDDAISFEDWIGTNEKYKNFDPYSSVIVLEENYYSASNTIIQYEDESSAKERNNEAKNLCEKFYKDYCDGIIKSDEYIHKDLFTSYVFKAGYINDEYMMPFVFVFHPVSMAIEYEMGTLIMAVVLAVVCIVIINSIIEKSYQQRLAYDRNKGMLTNEIANELEKPLMITKEYVENWEKLDTAERNLHSETLINEIEHMNKVVMDLLELSHLEAKNKQMNYEEVDLELLVISILKQMANVIDESHLKITLTSNNISMNMQDIVQKIYDENASAEEGVIVEADLEMMRVALVNLISKAIQCADRFVDIKLINNRNNVRFETIIDGEAINTDNVWDDFHNDKSKRHSNINASGIGLVITKNILILHGAKYGCKIKRYNTKLYFKMNKKIKK